MIEARGGGALYQVTLRMSHDFQAAAATGERDASGRIIDFWGGTGVFAGMPEAVQAYCRQAVTANVLDRQTAFGFAVAPEHLAALDVPVLLVRGALANPTMAQITDALREGLPRVQDFAVEGAGHFLVTTHAAKCAELLGSFLEGVEAVAG